MKKTILTLGFIAASYIPDAQVLYGSTSKGVLTIVVLFVN
jgi:hypothetical protein